MKMTILNVQIHKTDFHPETARIRKSAQEHQLLSELLPEVSRLDLSPTSEHRLTEGLVCAISTGIAIKMSPRHFELIQECFSLALTWICVCGGVTDLDCNQNEEKDDLLINKHNQVVSC